MSPRRAKAVSGRAHQDPATALREHLIDAAERLLDERPASTITTRDIARAAAVSDGVLYNYFSDKHDLLLAALLRRYQALAERFDASVPAPGSATVAQNLHGYAEAMLALHGRLLPTIAGLVSEPVLMHRFVEAIHGVPFGPQHNQHRMAGYIAAEQALGRIAADVDPQATSVLVTGAALVLVIANHVLPADARPAPAAQLSGIVETLMRGVGRLPQPDG
jgi:AcrR family transcriptional regulator